MVVVLALRGGKFRLVLSCNIKQDKQSVRGNSHWRGISSLDQKDSSTAACFIYRGGVGRGHFFPRPYHWTVICFLQAIKEVPYIPLFSRVSSTPLFLFFFHLFYFFFLLQLKNNTIFTKQKVSKICCTQKICLVIVSRAKINFLIPISNSLWIIENASSVCCFPFPPLTELHITAFSTFFFLFWTTLSVYKTCSAVATMRWDEFYAAFILLNNRTNL